MTSQEAIDELIKRRRVIERLGDSTEAMDAAIAALREREAVGELVAAARALDRWLYGWCPTQCSCAIESKPLAERLQKALAKFAELRKGEQQT